MVSAAVAAVSVAVEAAIAAASIGLVGCGGVCVAGVVVVAEDSGNAHEGAVPRYFNVSNPRQEP